MAAITIFRGLNEQGSDVDAPLVSAFTRNTIEFYFERGTDAGAYATVELNGHVFRAVRTDIEYVTNTDRYIFDCTDKLPAIIGLPPLTNDDMSELTAGLTVTLRGYSATNTLLTTNTSHPAITLSFGVPPIATGGGLDTVYELGRIQTVYHNGSISFFWKGSPGTFDLTIDGVTAQAVVLASGYNTITAGANLQKSGKLIRFGASDSLEVNVVYRPDTATGQVLSWINRDGCWSYWRMRELYRVDAVERDNEVEVWQPTNFTQKIRQQTISAMKEVDIVVDTIAINADHYKQLVEIAESPRVLYYGTPVKIASSSSLHSACRQNLKFNLTLRYSENVVSY